VTFSAIDQKLDAMLQRVYIVAAALLRLASLVRMLFDAAQHPMTMDDGTMRDTVVEPCTNK
jgi:hypothetical protein